MAIILCLEKFIAKRVSVVRILTIGGYGFSSESFLRALRAARVDTFVDIRQRRGMRGAKYSFLNSIRLQEMLQNAGINYLYCRALAPTDAVRAHQRSADRDQDIVKRERTCLSSAFISEYQSEILDQFDRVKFLSGLAGARAVALFCVEGAETACHRLLAANYLVEVLDGDQVVEHLRA